MKIEQNIENMWLHHLSNFQLDQHEDSSIINAKAYTG